MGMGGMGEVLVFSLPQDTTIAEYSSLLSFCLSGVEGDHVPGKVQSINIGVYLYSNGNLQIVNAPELVAKEFKRVVPYFIKNRNLPVTP